MADITATRHNNLQARIDNIFGVGSGQSGYGQTVASYPVSSQPTANNSTISATDLNSLYTDMIKARAHQTGVETAEIMKVLAEGASRNIAGEDTSNIDDGTGNVTTDPFGTAKGITDYEILMSKIEADKFEIFSGTLQTGISSTRSQPWNGLIVHEFTVSFSSSDQRRFFFNSGGEIRISGNNSGAAGTKGQDWNALLAEVGVIKFNYNETTSTLPNSGGVTVTAIGNYSLTTNYQTIYQKVGQGSVSGVYAGNIYIVKAREISQTQLQFRIELNDVVVGGTIDNDVDGTLTSTVQQLRADTDFVRVTGPVYANDTTLSSFSTPAQPPPPPAATADQLIPVIAIIDEASNSGVQQNESNWIQFRNTWPDRPFYLFEPGPDGAFSDADNDLNIPTVTQNDPLFTYRGVARDDSDVNKASDWYSLANVDQVTAGAEIALAIDNSGSMRRSTVQASIDLLVSKCNARGITIYELDMGSAEDWISVFNTNIVP